MSLRAAVPDLVACTIVSFRRDHPDVPFHVLLAEETGGLVDPAAKPFELIGHDEPDVLRTRRGGRPRGRAAAGQ